VVGRGSAELRESLYHNEPRRAHLNTDWVRVPVSLYCFEYYELDPAAKGREDSFVDFRVQER